MCIHQFYTPFADAQLCSWIMDIIFQEDGQMVYADTAL